MRPVEELKPMAYVGQLDDAEEEHSAQYQNSGPILKQENSDSVSGISISRRKILSGPSLTQSKRTGKKSVENNLTNGKICTEMYHNNQYGGRALRGVANSDVANKNQLKDKSDTSTKDNVLDRKTKLHISKMIIRGDIDSVEGCIAAGKEANVYYCTSKCTDFSGVHGKEIVCVLKVHKTCIATFKNRQEYNEINPLSKSVTEGDLKGHIVKWCEAESSNLQKLAEAGIPCPKVYSRYEHLLLMELVGAPRLHNSLMSSDLACTVYGKIVRYMRAMYWKCNMVHVDLSEFNILLLDNTPYISDVSQAVPRGHPNSFKHLRQDCINVTEFFRKGGVSTMMIQELFFFIVDMTITDENVESYLDESMAICSQRDSNEMTNEEKITENVFKNVLLPMTLNEAECFESDYEMIKAGLKSSIAILGCVEAGKGAEGHGSEAEDDD